jgi:hypothetical protein
MAGSEAWYSSSRRWRKLHLGVDADTYEVVAVELTQDDVGDVSELVGFLDQVATRVASVIADAAYDGETVYDAVTDRHSEADIIIPPRATAVPSTSGATQRDQHIATIEKHGRIGWQRRSGYNRRSLVEAAMYRYKTVIGRRLFARTLSGQQVEATIGFNALNRMTSIGMPATDPDRLMIPPAGTRPTAQYSRNKPGRRSTWKFTRMQHTASITEAPPTSILDASCSSMKPPLGVAGPECVPFCAGSLAIRRKVLKRQW